MKKFTLSILVLATVIGTVPSSIYPVDVAKDSIIINKDGVTITVYYSQYLSKDIKNRNLVCGHINIKNDTNEVIEVPKYAVLSPFMANEKTLKEAMCIIKKDILFEFFTGAITHTVVSRIAAMAISDLVWPFSHDFSLFLEDILRHTQLSSYTTGIWYAVCAHTTQTRIQEMLQKYLDRKATTIQVGKGFGFDAYIDLDKYQKSVDKNITIRLHKKDSDKVMLYEVDTTPLQTQAT